MCSVIITDVFKNSSFTINGDSLIFRLKQRIDQNIPKPSKTLITPFFAIFEKNIRFRALSIFHVAVWVKPVIYYFLQNFNPKDVQINET